VSFAPTLRLRDISVDPVCSAVSVEPPTFCAKGKKGKGKKRILFGLLYLRQAILPGYWILDIGHNWITEIQPFAFLSRKTLRNSSGIASVWKGLRVIREYWIQERNYSGRSVHQLKVSINVHPSLCPRSHLFPSCLAYFLFRFLIFRVMLLAGICILWSIPTTGNDDSCQSRRIASPSRYCPVFVDISLFFRFNEPRILHIILEGQQPELGLRPEPFPFSLSISVSSFPPMHRSGSHSLKTFSYTHYLSSLSSGILFIVAQSA
jgi:hypothetical protein